MEKTISLRITARGQLVTDEEAGINTYSVMASIVEEVQKLLTGGGMTGVVVGIEEEETKP